MKQLPDEQRITERMAPGVLCREGFLGNDPRGLQEIIDADRAAVRSAGTTNRQIAERLGEICRQAVAAMGTQVQAGPLRATWHEGMGRIPSPWGDGMFPKGELHVTDTRTGEGIIVTPLAVHMIDRHGFYQGRGSRYRIEPAQAARMLDLARE